MPTAKQVQSLVRKGRLKEARRCLAQMDAATARKPATRRARAMLAMQERRYSEAATLYQSLLSGSRPDRRDAEGLGFALLNLERFEQAREHYLRSLEQWPEAPELLRGLADSHSALGETEDARDALRRAVTLDQASGGAWYGLTMLGDYGWLHEHRESLLDAHKLARTPSDQYSAHFAAGRYLEKQGEYDAAFERFRLANELRRQWGALHIERKIAAAQTVMADWDTQDWSSTPPGSESAAPIFIIGMPRSGSSLVEQILDSHPDVAGVGEASYLQQEIGRTLRASNAPVSRLDWADAAQRYLTRVLPTIGKTARFTDKMLFNFNTVGFIRLMFPNARIVHCRRDPMDTCIACFRTDFRHLFLSYTLRELGQFYGYYEGMMDYWRDRFGKAIVDIRYEDLINDPKGEVERLLSELDLPWSDDCLAFHENPRIVSTASMQQVRQPLYRSAVGRAEPYRKHLGPLLEGMEDARRRMRPKASA